MNEMKSRLADILENMDIPEQRRNLNFLSNIRWLLRNLGAQNGDAVDYPEAVELLKSIERKSNRNG